MLNSVSDSLHRSSFLPSSVASLRDSDLVRENAPSLRPVPPFLSTEWESGLVAFHLQCPCERALASITISWSTHSLLSIDPGIGELPMFPATPFPHDASRRPRCGRHPSANSLAPIGNTSSRSRTIDTRSRILVGGISSLHIYLWYLCVLR